MSEKSPSWLELESVIPLASKDEKPTVETITSLSPDTIKRKYSEYVVGLSDRRQGMKLRNALKIANGK
jgi:hypothetical protein